MKRSSVVRGVVAGGLLGGIVLLCADPAAAAPALTGTSAVKSAVDSLAIDVRWRRWRRGYFIGSSYGWWSRRGCHIPGGYYRPNACW
jgi:hypothetical protein